MIPERPAAAAGMLDGDRIVSIAGVEVANWAEMAQAISDRAGTRYDLEVERGGSRHTLTMMTESPRVGGSEAELGGPVAILRADESKDIWFVAHRFAFSSMILWPWLVIVSIVRVPRRKRESAA